MSELERVIRQRRSTRMFLPHQPVPQELVYEALDLAVRAPSNSNIQPWHTVFAYRRGPRPPRHRSARRGPQQATRDPTPT